MYLIICLNAIHIFLAGLIYAYIHIYIYIAKPVFGLRLVGGGSGGGGGGARQGAKISKIGAQI